MTCLVFYVSDKESSILFGHWEWYLNEFRGNQEQAVSKYWDNSARHQHSLRSPKRQTGFYDIVSGMTHCLITSYILAVSQINNGYVFQNYIVRHYVIGKLVMLKAEIATSMLLCFGWWSNSSPIDGGGGHGSTHKDIRDRRGQPGHHNLPLWGLNASIYKHCKEEARWRQETMRNTSNEW